MFAFTMMTTVFSEMTVVARIGWTIGLCMLFNTLVIRAFMTSPIAALLGKWLCWPQVVRARPVSSGS